MEIAKIKKYKLPKESLLYVQEPQLMLFEDEFKRFGKKILLILNLVIEDLLSIIILMQ